MIAPRTGRKLAISLAVLSAGCNYGIYDNQNIRDVLSRMDRECAGLVREANGETSKCNDTHQKTFDKYAGCLVEYTALQNERTSSLTGRLLLTNPMLEKKDADTIAVALESVLGPSWKNEAKSEGTMLSIYDFVSEKIGVDSDAEGLLSPSETLSKKYANPLSRLILLSGMLEMAFPFATRIVETHFGGKVRISLEFNILRLDGMEGDAMKAEEALARAISARYGLPLPEARKLAGTGLKKDASGLWLELDPLKGREMGLGGIKKDEAAAIVSGDGIVG